MTASKRGEIIAALVLVLHVLVASGETRSSPTDTVEDSFSHEEPRDPMFFGCGRTDLESSYEYGLVNRNIHSGMSINYTGDAEYDLVAGLIPHRSAAADMCGVWREAVAAAGSTLNKGIDSLCHNITNGPFSRAEEDQHGDFSRPEESEQMLAVIETLDMTEHYEDGCSDLSEEERRDSLERRESKVFMGCGRLDLNSTKEHIAVRRDMHMRMALNFTGHPDVDFLLGMIPCHEGAIEMCEIYYKYWTCVPHRGGCARPSPLVGIADTVSDEKEESIRSNVAESVDRICGGHILTTQAMEVTWMKKELGKISPKDLMAYHAMKGFDTYPCNSQPGSDHAGMHGQINTGETNIGHTETPFGKERHKEGEVLDVTDVRTLQNDELEGDLEFQPTDSATPSGDAFGADDPNMPQNTGGAIALDGDGATVEDFYSCRDWCADLPLPWKSADPSEPHKCGWKYACSMCQECIDTE